MAIALTLTTRETLAINLRSTFESATPVQFQHGCMWYDVAHRLASEYGNVNEDADRLAILSAQTPWERNAVLFRMLKDGESRPGDVPQLRWDNALNRKMRSDGKVYNFAVSIRTAGMAGCCIDSHMLKCAFRNQVTKENVGQLFRKNSKLYAMICEIIAEIAEDYCITPAQAQSVIWVTWKGYNSRKRRSGREMHPSLF